MADLLRPDGFLPAISSGPGAGVCSAHCEGHLRHELVLVSLLLCPSVRVPFFCTLNPPSSQHQHPGSPLPGEALAFLVIIFSKVDPHLHIFSRQLTIVITLMGGEQGKLAKR